MTATATRSLVIERELPHAPDKVWRALTEGSLLKQWLMDNDFKPVVGHKFTFRATPVPNWNGIVECEVQVVDPNKSLSYSWGSMGAGTVGYRLSRRPRAGRCCAWSNPASGPIISPITLTMGRPATAGRSSSAALSGFSGT